MATAQDNAFQNGRLVTSFIGSVARTDTTAKTLFTLPVGFIPTNILYVATAPSNAGTTATLSVGKSGGTGVEYLNAVDIKTAGTGGGSQKPTASASTQFGVALTAAVTVTGTYAETGGASSSGGPWIVIIEGLCNTATPHRSLVCARRRRTPAVTRLIERP